ncbi:hypothetical protein PRZ48_009938 [Zasmidium cellare]|uniref:Carboxylesterase type B domain-containing protein n=1 Tax=Zasmidium cellare TaxID=395010 RepID=A0ABR0EDI7_ZASCE|nr:hypothetical protein PRZ48_009938 [Zasmidium cellare]
MIHHLILPTLLSAVVLATPIQERQPAPTVTIQNGTIIGSTSNGIDSFKGIPFAQPPTGNLRLRPPQSITQGFGTIQATAQPKACPQQSNQVDTSDLPSDVIGELVNSPLFQAITNAGEDCLTVNVQRPEGVRLVQGYYVRFVNSLDPNGGGMAEWPAWSNEGQTPQLLNFLAGGKTKVIADDFREGAYGYLVGNESQFRV